LNRRRCCMTLPRVLTVGFEFTIPNMPTAGRRFQSEHYKQPLRNGVHAVHVRRIAIHSATVNPVPLMGTTIYVAPKPHRHSIADTGAGPYFTHFFNPAGRFIESAAALFIGERRCSDGRTHRSEMGLVSYRNLRSHDCAWIANMARLSFQPQRSRLPIQLRIRAPGVTGPPA
jgi:hypothetical protein